MSLKQPASLSKVSADAAAMARTQRLANRLDFVNKFVFISEILLYLLVFWYQHHYGADHGSTNEGHKLPGEAYWGAVTANIDWCEQNYQHFHFLCEFWNAISSLSFCILGALGLWIYKDVRGHAFHFHIMYGMLIVIGAGSFMFHATMLHEMQMFDELPMIYLVVCFCYEAFTWRMDPVDDAHRKAGIFIVLVLYCAGMTIAMKVVPEHPFVFQIPFFCISIYLIAHLFRLMRNDTMRATMSPETQFIMQLGLTYFFVGTFCWPMERLFCEHVEVFQLHAMWHLCATMGVHHFIQTFISTHMHVQGGSPKLQYTLCGLFPYFMDEDAIEKKN